MSQTTEKSFDCLAFKWKVQAEIYQEIKDQTPNSKSNISAATRKPAPSPNSSPSFDNRNALVVRGRRAP